MHNKSNAHVSQIQWSCLWKKDQAISIKVIYFKKE
jgi:hypothetical protein